MYVVASGDTWYGLVSTKVVWVLPAAFPLNRISKHADNFEAFQIIREVDDGL